MYLATLDCATSNPSLSSSPWMRGPPQSGFSILIRRIKARSSVSICGRPPRGRDFLTHFWLHLPRRDVVLPVFFHCLFVGILEDQDAIGHAIRIDSSSLVVAARNQFTSTVCLHAITDLINTTGLVRFLVFDVDFSHEIVGGIVLGVQGTDRPRADNNTRRYQ